jgi:hypothetical protein
MKRGISTTLIAITLVSGLPSTVHARYLQADPIGPTRSFADPLLAMQLREGLIKPSQVYEGLAKNGALNHPYAYADDNPVTNIDPLGLANGPAVNWQNGNLNYGNYMGTNDPCLQCKLAYQLVCAPMSFGMKQLGFMVGSAVGGVVGRGSGGGMELGGKIGSAAFTIGGMGICQLEKDNACEASCKKDKCPTDGNK